MPPSVRAVESAPALPGVPRQGPVHLWSPEAGEVRYLPHLPHRRTCRTCRTCRSDAGDANGNWKGGRTRHKAGYVMVRAPGHPRAGRRSPYVFEHILVAEEILGRHLVDGESVHHRNGVRDDNRPENLELWTRPQPSGIRVSDAIEWARQIYERYGGPGAPPTMLTLSPEHPWRWRESNPRPSAPQ